MSDEMLDDEVLGSGPVVRVVCERCESHPHVATFERGEAGWMLRASSQRFRSSATVTLLEGDRVVSAAEPAVDRAALREAVKLPCRGCRQNIEIRGERLGIAFDAIHAAGGHIVRIADLRAIA